MPYIHVTTSVVLSAEHNKKLVSALGEIITEIPGKSEEWLMIGIKDENKLYFKGVQKDLAAVVEISIFGSAQKQYKESITKKVCEFLQIELSIPMDSVYVMFREVEDWGWNGKMF